MKKLKILVFDDNKVNRAAAKAQLKAHKLTVVSTYDEAEELLRVEDYEDEKVIYPDFDVVLTDLLVPASGLGSCDHLVGEEMPVGIFIALLAAKNNVKKVAVLTDSNHHEHPASSCLDAFNAGEVEPTAFTVGNGKIILTNNRNWIGNFYPDDLTTPLGWEEVEKKKRPTVIAKDWSSLLEYLLEQK
jgi:CheY-like chemotaxis protein